ncbi:MAG: aminotransferase class I/II-fold pyridoxal phosphate-dependent enzyme [Anaerolineae bacterium]
MLDFTSVLYLGFRHGSRSVYPWSQLTTGTPTALAEPAVARHVAGRLAQLQGCEQAMVGPSTLHLFWDLFAQLSQQSLSKRPFAIFLDAGAYPIAQWGVERAEMRGVPLYRFPHQDVQAVTQLVRRVARKYRPLIVSDGLCSSCGCTAPVSDYLEIVRAHQGLLVLDDTQALGLLGFLPDDGVPYGRFGGGTLPHQAISGPELIVISSLAKSFGVPLAVLSGSREAVLTFQDHSETRIHCSPPSIATLHAAERALTLNEGQGERRRYQLARNVTLFRRLLAEEGFFTTGGLFPVQTLRLPPGTDIARLYKVLSAGGIRSVLRRGCNGRAAISFVITVRHRPDDIKQAVEKLTIAIDAR